jgi:hypothetical protein
MGDINCKKTIKMGMLGFEPRSKAYFRKGFIIVVKTQSSTTGGPYSSQVILHPHRD